MEALSASKEPWPEAAALEQRIFEAFPLREDDALCSRFHRADWPGRAALIRDFADSRLRQIAQRLVYAHDPALLGADDAVRISSAIGERLHIAHGNDKLWRTLGQARSELDDVHEGEGGERLASEISAYLEALAHRYPAPEA